MGYGVTRLYCQFRGLFEDSRSLIHSLLLCLNGASWTVRRQYFGLLEQRASDLAQIVIGLTEPSGLVPQVFNHLAVFSNGFLIRDDCFVQPPNRLIIVLATGWNGR